MYNNENQKKKINSSSFIISIDGNELLYTYIRKNACTSFKKLFKYYSPHDFHQVGGDLKGMSYYYRVVDIEKAKKAKYRIFIYRDPVERVISVFKNKFIQRSGAEDILNDFQTVTGLFPEKITFYDFVTLYVAKILEGVKIDAHLLPQQWHLLPIAYNAAISLDAIKPEMKKIVGNEIGEQFFSKPVNSTKSNQLLEDKSYWEDNVSNLRSIYEDKNAFPSNESLLSDEIIEIIKSIYVDDYNMIDSLS